MRPGGSIFLRSGTYRGTFTSEIEGTPADPIIVRSFPGEWAILDGETEPTSTLTVNGADTHFAAIEVAKSDPERLNASSSPRPTNFARADANGIDVFGPRTKLLDVVVHDHRHGVGLWRPAVDAEIRGAVIFNNGWVGADRSWGHGIYTQNLEGTKQIVDSLVFNNFGYGIHGYGLNAHVNGVTVEGVTSFENGAPAGVSHPNIFAGASEHPVDRLAVRASILYHRPSSGGSNLELGFTSGSNGSAEVRDNVVVGGSTVFKAVDFENLDIQGNVFRTEQGHTGNRHLVNLQTDSGGVPSVIEPLPGYIWDRNTYIDRSDRAGGSFASFLFDADNEDEALTFPDWQEATGADGQSSYATSPSPVTEVFIRPTGGGPAIITVLNWPGRRTVEIDLGAAGLTIGANFEIRDAQAFLGEPLLAGTWHGGPIEIRLDSRSVTQPVGAGAHSLERTPIEFGAFVLLPR